ncbi:PEP-CTERM sorting domain-containing protein [Methylomonas sp. EFPC3]|uniref:exosortase-dependent surface protein XDP1 n=1 Tax=Methylomonas TaxID=416 RepID=UPI0016428383|nr:MULTISPECIES: exosortase-dependent surface protein XDP1 [Methylomonas]WFP50912.1 PEP-CTERM sorting domain-containing protein [Methylomonas sp. EFPC3]
MIRKYLAITTLLLTPFAANATTWTLGGATPAGITSINAYSVGTSATSTFASATVGKYSGGLGVTTSGESTTSPEHATDNVGNIEALLFRFDSDTILDKLTIGWPSVTSGYDSDISVLRYTGTLTNNALPTDRDISNEKISDLLARGWEFVGSYNTAQNVVEDINPNNLSSSFWLISAYSSTWGTGKGDPSTELTNSNDYFKLASLVGTTASTSPGPGASVPEPTSLLLLASGIFGWRINSKKRTLTA